MAIISRGVVAVPVMELLLASRLGQVGELDEGCEEFAHVLLGVAALERFVDHAYTAYAVVVALSVAGRCKA